MVALGVANLAYFFAVTQRTSLGVASLEASKRFETTASQLASLAVLQLVVYAGMQIPVGVLLDRFGPRILLASGALAMGGGQLLVAFAPNLTMAVFGRMLVGLGDACTFISMIRMVNNWTSGSKASKLQQWMATLGQLGQVASAIPFVWLLKTSGWVVAFTSLASTALLVSAVIWLAVVDSPAHNIQSKPRLSQVLVALRESVARASSRMGFWTHFCTQSSGTMFALLWGVPFVTSGEGYSPAVASGLLILFVFTNATLGPILGSIAARGEHLRSRIIITAPLAGIVAWVVVLLLPGQAPMWLLVSLVLVIGVGGPASMLAFDYTRIYVKKTQLGVVNGFVNIGGFLASLVMMAGVGVVLDSLNKGQGRETLYSLNHFREALPVQFAITLIGLAMYLRERKRTYAVEGLPE